MDFYQELLLTGLISVLIAFLIRKIASVAADDGDGDSALASSAGPSAHGASAHPIAGEEIARNSPPAPPFDVEPQRLDLEKEEIAEEVPQKGDFIEQKEGFARDEEAEEDVVELGGANAVENEDVIAVEEKDGLLLDGEDDWEGIERSELEKLFGVAAEFVSSEKGGDAVSKLSDEAQLLLYGLHKVATEGPCYEPKPMTLMVSARSKWYAWQRLGNMNPEAAMEEYIGLLNNSIPGWMVQEPVEQAKGNGGKDPQAVEITQIDQQGLTKAFLFNLLSPTREAF
ncbi:hypothetical protein ZIOFF_029952 [Zingiber officinale]|uniref:ACB domain-containing protein n=2 Tax=Zingiber officinale TaxID=94328 RepID=A0A8J5LGP4_ZINOF|nr:hypothetical protein ZIOFF_029952 [Zingiber officinale]